MTRRPALAPLLGWELPFSNRAGIPLACSQKRSGMMSAAPCLRTARVRDQVTLKKRDNEKKSLRTGSDLGNIRLIELIVDADRIL